MREMEGQSRRLGHRYQVREFDSFRLRESSRCARVTYPGFFVSHASNQLLGDGFNYRMM